MGFLPHGGPRRLMAAMPPSGRYTRNPSARPLCPRFRQRRRTKPCAPSQCLAPPLSGMMGFSPALRPRTSSRRPRWPATRDPWECLRRASPLSGMMVPTPGGTHHLPASSSPPLPLAQTSKHLPSFTGTARRCSRMARPRSCHVSRR